MKTKTIKIILEIVKVVVTTLLGYLEGSTHVLSNMF